MKKMILIMCVILLTGAIFGCAPNSNTNSPGATTSAAATTTAAEATTAAAATAATTATEANTEASDGPEPNTLPISDVPIKLTFFVNLDAKAAATRSTLSELEQYAELKEATNIEIEFVHPPANAIDENFNLMLASDQLTDFVFKGGWFNVVGGVDKLIEDGQILDLRGPVAQWGPNFTKILERYPEIDIMLSTANGYYAFFPELRETEEQNYIDMLQIREDWLIKLGLDFPATIDDWYNVLTAFKTQDPNGNGEADELPMVAQDGKNHTFTNLGSAWGINANLEKADAMFVRDGQIVYSLLEPEYRDFLETMTKWYAEGLIDPDYLTTDAAAFQAKVLNDQAGSYWGNTNGHMGTFLATKLPDNPEFSLRAVHFPKAPDGNIYDFYSQGIMSPDGAAINAKSKYIKEAVKFYDYFFSEAGILYSNYGVEGITYDMVDGKPVFREEYVFNNPEGLSPSQALARHATTGVPPKGFQLLEYWNSTRIYEQQFSIGTEGLKGTNERMIPMIKMTPEDSTSFSAIVNEINTYAKEMSARFILGDTPYSEYDGFVEAIRSMGAEDAVALRQKAYENYMRRAN